MNRRVIVGIVCLVTSIALQLGWEFFGREKLLYTDVLTVNQDIEVGTEITSDMLTTKKVINASTRSYRVTQEALLEIVGKEATSYIPYGEELYPEFFEEQALVVHKGEYILSIPSTWLVSRPQTLRRGDTVTFLTTDGQTVTSATVLYVKDGSNAEVVSSDAERLNAAGSVAVIEVIVSESDAKLLTSIAGQEENNHFVLIYNN